MKRGISSKFGFVLLPLIIFLCASCLFQKGTSGDVIKYVENPENGLRKNVSVGNCDFTFQYKPAAYILKQEHPENPAMEKNRLRQLDSMVWFNVSIQISGYNQSPLKYAAKNIDEYNARLNYYLNDARTDYYLITGTDTMAASAYWFVDNKGLTPIAIMVVGFKLRDAKKVKHDLRLAYYDRVFRSGIIKTVIKIKDIDAIAENI